MGQHDVSCRLQMVEKRSEATEVVLKNGENRKNSSKKPVPGLALAMLTLLKRSYPVSAKAAPAMRGLHTSHDENYGDDKDGDTYNTLQLDPVSSSHPNQSVIIEDDPALWSKQLSDREHCSVVQRGPQQSRAEFLKEIKRGADFQAVTITCK
ncbi:hypothetical protein CHS0354_027502 [Potamilus streckersoni]|uniref:Uncharacterized protein n=1 Tax=Potamilus streckersoni TaxID=2493646 RepID=A0AAE0VP89_9BIVA|nr:hypothetical protein CHS0354_027502 [Potamilus streckersoni]